MPSTTQPPQHIAIIMDGNRRWAKAHKLAALQGHAQVADRVIEPLVDRCVERGVKNLTLWAFSTENWHRDQAEVMGLMELFRRSFAKSSEALHAKGVRLNVIGDLSKFPIDIQANIRKWLEISKDNQKITVTFALNYGGRDEIARAVTVWHRQAEPKAELGSDELAGYLDTTGLPDPDLIIRPGGELRLSGFLPWQSVYSELYFTDVLMPDFSPPELDKALDEFADRQRRFGT